MKPPTDSYQCSESVPLSAHPPLSLDLFIRQTGLSPVTCWRYRRRGWLETIVIANRHYVTREAIAKFNKRAAAGEFAGTLSNPSTARARKEAK
jgi:hypothetical protein